MMNRHQEERPSPTPSSSPSHHHHEHHRHHHGPLRILSVVLYVSSWVANAETLQGITNGTFCPHGVAYDKPTFLTWLSYNFMMLGCGIVTMVLLPRYYGDDDDGDDGNGNQYNDDDDRDHRSSRQRRPRRRLLWRYLDTTWRGRRSWTTVSSRCAGLGVLLTSCHILYVVGLRHVSVAVLNATYQVQAVCAAVLSARLLPSSSSSAESPSSSAWRAGGMALAVAGITAIVVPPLIIRGGGDDDDKTKTTTWDTLVGIAATVGSAVLWGFYQVAWEALYRAKFDRDDDDDGSGGGNRGKSPNGNTSLHDLIDTLMTLAVIGLFNLTVGWLVIPLMDVIGFETFEWPPASHYGILTVNALVEYAFNACIALAIHVTSPLTTSLTAPLIIPLSWVTDAVLYHISVRSATAGAWGWCGAAAIVGGLYFMERQSDYPASTTTTTYSFLPRPSSSSRLEATTLLTDARGQPASQQPYVLASAAEELPPVL